MVRIYVPCCRKVLQTMFQQWDKADQLIMRHVWETWWEFIRQSHWEQKYNDELKAHAMKVHQILLFMIPATILD